MDALLFWACQRMDMRRDVGRRLASERSAKGLSQKEFAAIGGIKEGAQGLYETGKSSPNADYLCRLHRHGIDIGYVLTGIRSEQSSSAEYADIVSNLSRLSDRERRAIGLLIGGLLGRAPQTGSIAEFYSPDELAMMQGAIGSVHERRSGFKSKDDGDG